MTNHKILVGNSNHMGDIADRSVHLVITSPPYPMIEMWDEMFSDQDIAIKEALVRGQGLEAFYRMHSILNAVWAECDRVLVDNGFICVNIGDAVSADVYTDRQRLL